MIFLAFIVGIVLGGLIGAGFIYSAEIVYLRKLRERVEKVENAYNGMVEDLKRGQDTADDWCE